MPVARFQTSDGRIARFEVPEGTTPEQAVAMIEREFPNLGTPKKTNNMERLITGEPLQRSTADELGRQLGLTVRYGAEGITSLPNTVGDLFGLRSTEAVSNLLTKLGLPKPEGATERVVGDMSRAVAGQVVPISAGAAMMNSAPGAARNVGELLAARPGLQMVGAAGAGGAAGTTRELGGGPIAQTVAGLLGGLVAPIAADVSMEGAKAAVRAARAAAKPFTQSGREEVVGDTMRRLATNPETAAERMGAAPEYVPGSKPTTAQASRDPGLLTAERALRSGSSGGQFAERVSQQNQARNALLNTLAGDEASLQAAKGAREGTAGALYRKAADEGIDLEMAKAMKPQIDNLMERMPKGVIEKAKELARVNGEAFDAKGSVKGLHWIKMAVDDAIDSAKKTGVGSQTQRGLLQFKDDLLSVMDELSPTYAKARVKYADMSKPVNQMETLQGVRSQVLNAGTDPATGERIMSAAKFYNAVTKNEAELAKVLTPKQMTSLKAISQDLDRGALSDSAGKAAGSNTYQNVSTAYVIGKALGGEQAASPMVQNLLRPLAWLNKLNEPQLQELLTDAMLNPALARSLMSKASTRSVESLSMELQGRARALGLGSMTATGSQASGDKRSEKREEATAQ